mmetsp:Transcript_36546/g.66973  ORF Transcript_36546/g.66973 Transcript_36546/m.66973 type:complete len:306 (-) Transcript_36546:101-1018(-)
MSALVKYVLLALSLQASCLAAADLEVTPTCLASRAPALLQVALSGTVLSDLDAELQRLLRSGAIADTEECDLCGGDQRWLFVIGTGRSGSTSVMSMLNAIPGIHLSGENWAAMESLQEFYDRVLKTNGTANSGAWAREEFSATSVLCKMQAVMKAFIAPMPNSTLIGFKEIRHDTPDLDFFEKLFPCARYIINYRSDTEAQAASQATHLSRHLELDDLELDLANKTAHLRSWSERHTDDSFPIILEDFSVDTFNNLLDWLGIEGCKYLTVSHANQDGFGQDEAVPEMEGSCYFRDSSAGNPDVGP